MPTFNVDDCTCDHDAVAHDDGFGCTAPDCPCLAQWSFAYGGGAW